MCNGCVYHICVLLICPAPLMRVHLMNRRGTFHGGVFYGVSKVTDSTVPLYSGSNLSLKIMNKRSLFSEGGGMWRSALMTSKMQVP